jgi:putative lipoprotein
VIVERKRLLGFALAITALALWGVPLDAQGTGTVTGTVTYRERIALPPDAVVRVQLQDVSRADAPATVVAETSFPTGGKQVPFPFTLTYDPAQIRPTNSYAVRATIESGGQLLFTTTTRYAVITMGNPTNVDIVVQQVGGGTSTGSGNATVGLPQTGRAATHGGGMPIAFAIVVGVLAIAIGIVLRRHTGRYAHRHPRRMHS